MDKLFLSRRETASAVGLQSYISALRVVVLCSHSLAESCKISRRRPQASCNEIKALNVTVPRSISTIPTASPGAVILAPLSPPSAISSSPDAACSPHTSPARDAAGLAREVLSHALKR